MRKCLSLIFLLGCLFQLIAQNQQRIDSLENLLSQATAVNQRVDLLIQIARQFSTSDPVRSISLCQQAFDASALHSYPKGQVDASYGLGWIQMMRGKNDSAFYFFRKGISVADSIDYSLGKTDLQHGLAILFRNLGQYDSALHYEQRASVILETEDDLTRLSSNYNGLAGIYHRIGDYEQALKYHQKSLRIDSIRGDTSGIAATYNNVGYAYKAMGNLSEALDQFIKSLILKEKMGDKRGIAGTNMNIGDIFLEMNTYEKALSHFQQALTIQLELNDQRYIGANYLNIGNVYGKMGLDSVAIQYYDQALAIQQEIGDEFGMAISLVNLAESQLALGDLKKAQQHIRESMAKAEQINVKPVTAEVYIMRGRIDLGGKQYASAQFYLKKGIQLAKEIGEKKSLRDGYHYLYLAEEQLGHWKASLEAHKNYHQYYDSLLGEEQQKQLASLEVEYETEKKQQQIANLHQAAQIQGLELQQKNKNILLLGALAIALLLVAMVIYAFKQKQQLSIERKAQDIEQKLLRVQMNPHFIFNAMSSIQNYMFHGDTKQASLYLSKFSKLIRQVLDNSRSEFITLEEEISMIDHYISLENQRGDRQFNYEITVDPSIDPEEVVIPPMFAQPFVENAIEHGINQMEDAFIKIEFVKIGDNLRLRISDNGQGIEENVPTKKDHVSHATQITKERVALYRKIAGSNISFDIERLSPGTLVTFSLPLKYA